MLSSRHLLTLSQEAVELQAIDRVHRFGQDKPVEIIRFVVDDSIEDKMICAYARTQPRLTLAVLQKRKTALVEA